MDCGITKQTDGRDAYYTIRWSPIAKANKFDIRAKVPAMGGVAELYFKDDHGKLNLYMLARSYYGGLRATLRVATDPEEEKDERRRAVLLAHEGEIYYRYALMESQDDMTDIVYFFLTTYSPKADIPHSNRYERIFVKELDEGHLVTV